MKDPMLVFIHINKTAGRTVRYILRSSFGADHCEAEPWHAQWQDPPFSAPDLRRLRRIYPSLRSIGGHRVTGFVDLEENGTRFDYFTFMRDPLKTCASRFQYNVQYRGKKDLVFEDWISKEWTRNNQTRMIAGSTDAARAIRTIREKNIFVGLTEHFDESMLLLRALRAPNLNISYRPINVARKNELAQQLLSNERTRAMLIDANRADLELYEFVRQELFPGFQREYGPDLGSDLAEYQANRDLHFNSRNITISRLKQYMIYKPLLYMYRRGLRMV